MRAHPVGWTINDLEVVAEWFEIRIRRGTGSHVVFTHPATRTALTVPERRPLQPIYVRKFVELVDEVS